MIRKGIMKEPWYFGIDGGGTHSRLALVNRYGEVRVQVTGGSTNIYSVSPEQVFENVTELLDRGLREASLEREDLAGGCIGSAGLGRSGEVRLFRDFFDILLGSAFPVTLCGDGEILLCGGLEGLEGYCLIAGTGSLALGRATDGRLVRAGGLGYLLGDEGAAAWIGRTAIARTLRSVESRDIPTAMLPRLLAACNREAATDLIAYIHRDAGKAEIAALAPTVTAAAQEGDPLALDILHTGAEELALLVRSVIQQSPWIQNRALVLAGGVMEHTPIVSGKLKALLAREFPELVVTPPRKTALEGACLLAVSSGTGKR
jgi:N-acetylglucosamine kinase-like BadF-type ATPase